MSGPVTILTGRGAKLGDQSWMTGGKKDIQKAVELDVNALDQSRLVPFSGSAADNEALERVRRTKGKGSPADLEKYFAEVRAASDKEPTNSYLTYSLMVDIFEYATKYPTAATLLAYLRARIQKIIDDAEKIFRERLINNRLIGGTTYATIFAKYAPLNPDICGQSYKERVAAFLDFCATRVEKIAERHLRDPNVDDYTMADTDENLRSYIAEGFDVHGKMVKLLPRVEAKYFPMRIKADAEFIASDEFNYPRNVAKNISDEQKIVQLGATPELRAAAAALLAPLEKKKQEMILREPEWTRAWTKENLSGIHDVLNGAALFPSQLKEALKKLEGVLDSLEFLIDREEHATIRAEMTRALYEKSFSTYVNVVSGAWTAAVNASHVNPARMLQHIEELSNYYTSDAIIDGSDAMRERARQLIAHRWTTVFPRGAAIAGTDAELREIVEYVFDKLVEKLRFRAGRADFETLEGSRYKYADYRAKTILALEHALRFDTNVVRRKHIEALLVKIKA